MLVKGDISALLLAGLKTQFFKTFTEQPSDYDKICTVVPSDKDTRTLRLAGGAALRPRVPG